MEKAKADTSLVKIFATTPPAPDLRCFEFEVTGDSTQDQEANQPRSHKITSTPNIYSRITGTSSPNKTL